MVATEVSEKRMGRKKEKKKKKDNVCDLMYTVYNRVYEFD